MEMEFKTIIDEKDILKFKKYLQMSLDLRLLKWLLLGPKKSPLEFSRYWMSHKIQKSPKYV